MDSNAAMSTTGLPGKSSRARSSQRRSCVFSNAVTRFAGVSPFFARKRAMSSGVGSGSSPDPPVSIPNLFQSTVVFFPAAAEEFPVAALFPAVPPEFAAAVWAACFGSGVAFPALGEGPDDRKNHATAAMAASSAKSGSTRGFIGEYFTASHELWKQRCIGGQRPATQHRFGSPWQAPAMSRHRATVFCPGMRWMVLSS